MEEATHVATFLVASEIVWRVRNCDIQSAYVSNKFQPWVVLTISFAFCIAAVYLDLKNVEFFKSSFVRNTIKILHALDGLLALSIGLGLYYQNSLLFDISVLMITKLFLLHLLSRMVTGVKAHDKFAISVQTTKTFLHHTGSFFFLSNPKVIIITALWRFVSMNGHAVMTLKDYLSTELYDSIMWKITHARNVIMVIVLVYCYFDSEVQEGFAVSAVGHAAYMIVRLGPVFRLGSLYFPNEESKKAWNDTTDWNRLMHLLKGGNPLLALELGLLALTTVVFLVLRVRHENVIDPTTCAFT